MVTVAMSWVVTKNIVVHKYFLRVYDGERHNECGSFTKFRFKDNRSFVIFDNVFYNSKTKTHTATFGGSKNPMRIAACIPIPLSDTVIGTLLAFLFFTRTFNSCCSGID
jgi:hypothetical protein